MQAARGASLIGDREHADPAARRPRFLLAVAVGLATLTVDQVSKYLAVDRLAGSRPVHVLGDLLQLYLVRNPGAAFSAGSSVTWVFTVLAFIASAVLLHYARRARTSLWAVAIGLLLGGVVGNLTDRVIRPPATFHGHVIDFLMLPHWPVFNIADACLNVGVGLVILQAARGVQLDGSRGPRRPRPSGAARDRG